MSYALVLRERSGREPSAVGAIVEGLARRGLRVAGFTQRTFEDASGRMAVDVVRLRDGQSVPLARMAADAGNGPGVCSFTFDADAFARARGWIDEDLACADVVVLDAVGKLELGGAGHRAAIEHALRAGPPVVLSVREEDLVYAMEALGLGEPLAACATGGGAEALKAFVDQVAVAATTSRS